MSRFLHRAYLESASSTTVALMMGAERNHSVRTTPDTPACCRRAGKGGEGGEGGEGRGQTLWVGKGGEGVGRGGEGGEGRGQTLWVGKGGEGVGRGGEGGEVVGALGGAANISLFSPNIRLIFYKSMEDSNFNDQCLYIINSYCTL